MKSTLLYTLVVMACSFASLRTANAHYLWIERSGTNAQLLFGEYEESARERSPGRLDEIPAPRAQQVTNKPATMPALLQKQATGFAFPALDADTQALLAKEPAVPVKDWRKAGIGIVKPLFYARHQSRFDPQAEPTLTLDILPAKDEGCFHVYFRGKPLPKAEVKIVASNTWAQESRTNDNGMVQLPLPWKGQYILQVIHLEPVAGSYEGQAYQARRHRATLTYVTASGDATFSPRPAARP